MTKINDKLNKDLFKMTSSETITSFTKKSGTFSTPNGEVTIQKNDNYFRISGYVNANNVTANGDVEFSTSLRPRAEITIATIRGQTKNNSVVNLGPNSATLGTNGVVTLRMVWAVGSGESSRHSFLDNIYELN